MALLVPSQQTGLSPVQAPRQRTGQTGVADVIGTLADTAGDIASAEIERQRASEMRGARVAAVEGLAALGQQFDQDPDFDGLDVKFNAAVGSLQARISENLDPRFRDQFDTDFRGMVVPYKTRVGNRQHGLRRDEELAHLQAANSVILNQAAAAPDADTRAEILTNGAANIGAAKAAGWISATDELQLVDALGRDAEAAAAARMMREDPAELIQALDDGDLNSLPPNRREVLRTQAQNEIDREEARALRQAEREEKAASVALKNRVDNALHVIRAGLPFDGLSDLAEAVSGTEYERTILASVWAAQYQKDFALKSPAEQKQAISEFKRQATSDPDDVDRLKALEDIHIATQKAIAEDPIKRLQDVNAWGPLVWSDPASIERRVGLAVAAHDEGQSKDLRFFTNAERDDWAGQMADGSPDDRLTGALAILSTFPRNRAGAALEELGQNDPILVQAGRLVLRTGGRTDVARAVLIGQKLLKDKGGIKPDAQARDRARSSLAQAFPETSGQRETIKNILEVADAHFAAGNLDLDDTATQDEKNLAYWRSVQAVTGRVSENRNAHGGAVSVNGRMTILPFGIRHDAVEAMLTRNMSHMMHWADASAGGGAPYLGDDLFGGEEEVQLHYIGEDQYLVSVPSAGGRYLRNPSADDGLYRMHLPTFMTLPREKP